MEKQSNINELTKQIQEMLERKENNSKGYEFTKRLRPADIKALNDLQKNHDNSWAVEMYRRNEKNLSDTALLYRGNKISYGEMFSKAFEYAKSLKSLGYEKGTKIPACVTNMPEFIYLFLATSFIGAELNVVGDWFDPEYLTSILNDTKSEHIFVDDIAYEKIKHSIDESNVKDIVMFSLTDSFKKDNNGKPYNPFEEIDNVFHPITNKVNDLKNITNMNILDEKEFSNLGKSYDKNVIEDVNLDDICTLTYTSGTTNPGRPKGVIQTNRSYLTLSRYKESDVSNMPSMRNVTVLGHIPTYTHMELTCAVSDTFFEKCTLALEPFYEKEFFPYSLKINEPNFVPASNGFWKYLCKLLNYNESWKNVNMPYLMIPTVTGEAASPGEEKFYNKTSRKHKFGTGKLPFPLSPVTFSIGGGTTESSGILVTLYKALQELKLNYLIKNETLGLTPHPFVDMEVLTKDGEYAKVGEPGLIVANSPCNMVGYTDEELNKHTHIKDKTGKEWMSLNTLGYKSDKVGRIKMKGRLNSTIFTENDKEIYEYMIEDAISKDTKNIMSCSLIRVPNEKDVSYVAHIEFQPERKNNESKIIESCIERLKALFPEELLNKMFLRIRTFEEDYPVAPSGKRNCGPLIEEGISEKCIPVANEINLEKGISYTLK